MHRALIKILVGLAVALGLTLTSTPAAQAAPGSAGSAVSAAVPGCAAQEAALARSKSKHGQAVRKARKARNALARARRAEQRASTRKAKKATHKVVVGAKKRVQATRKKAATKKGRVRTHQGRVAACRSTVRPNPGARLTAASPIQALCDAGVPQSLCDALAGLAPAATSQTSMSQLCVLAPEAKPLCDLLSGLAPNATALEDLLATIAAQLDPALIESILGSLLQQLGVADLISLQDLAAILGNVLDEIAALLDPLDLGLGDLVDQILDLLGRR